MRKTKAKLQQVLRGLCSSLAFESWWESSAPSGGQHSGTIPETLQVVLLWAGGGVFEGSLKCMPG